MCSEWDSIVKRPSAAATQGKLEQKVCRGWDEGMKQGKNQEREQTKRNQKEEPKEEQTKRNQEKEKTTC